MGRYTTNQIQIHIFWGTPMEKFLEENKHTMSQFPELPGLPRCCFCSELWLQFEVFLPDIMSI